MSGKSRQLAGEDSADPEQVGRAIGLALLAWLIPGAAHFVLGQMSKAVVFAVTLTGMFVIGCVFGGRLFPFDWSEWMVLLPAIAEWGLAIPRVVAGIGGFGSGEVTSITYEYGNTFLMTAGLLNALVALNAFDLARKRTRP